MDLSLVVVTVFTTVYPEGGGGGGRGSGPPNGKSKVDMCFLRNNGTDTP